MRRIYYSFFFGLQIFLALDIWGYQFQSVTIQLVKYKFTVDQWRMTLKFFKGILHPSTYSTFRHNSTRHKPPGQIYPSCAVHFLLYVCLPFNKFYLTPNLSNELSGDGGIWTRDLRLAKALLSHWATSPGPAWLVGLTGFEPVTPALSAQCSNQLSYKPKYGPWQLRSDREQFFPSSNASTPLRRFGFLSANLRRDLCSFL